MEREGMKEKQDRSLDKRMKAFLMDEQKNEESPDSFVAEEISEKEKPGTQEHCQVRKVNSTGPSERNIVESFKCLEKCSFTDQNRK